MANQRRSLCLRMGPDAWVALSALALAQLGSLLYGAWWFGGRVERMTAAIEHLVVDRERDLARIERLEDRAWSK